VFVTSLEDTNRAVRMAVWRQRDGGKDCPWRVQEVGQIGSSSLPRCDGGGRKGHLSGAVERVPGYGG